MTNPDWLISFAAIVASVGGLARATTWTSVRFAGLACLLAGWLGLVVGIAPDSVSERWPFAAIATAALFAIGWLASPLLFGRERWILAAGGLALVFRVPVPTGDGTAMLLAPLYVVIGVGALVLLRAEWGAMQSADAPRTIIDRGGATRLIDVGTALLPVIAALSLTWSIDVDASAEVLAFFLVPFLLLYAVTRSWLQTGTDIRPATIALLGATLVAATLGLFQAATQQVWWNPKVVDANRFRPDFRTNSLFWDPNIYGRVLVVGALAVIAFLLVSRMTRRSAGATATLLFVLALALWHTYSQSSWVAAGASLLVLGVLTTPPRPRRWLATLLAIAFVVGVPLAVDQLAGRDAAGRRDVVRSGISLMSEKPLLGWGVGSFETAARAREAEQGTRTGQLTASHTTPITVAAELGVLGSIAYLTLLASAMVAALARWRRASTPAAAARARGESHAPGWPIAPVIWATATVVALFAHSLLYAGFFEDATLWVALAVLASLPVVVTQHDDGPS